jgi:hypothetical protein
MTLTNAYCTTADARNSLTISDLDDDVLLEGCISAASRQIDRYCNRWFWQDASLVTREFFAYDSRNVYVNDISTTTGLVVKVDINADGTFAQTLTIATNFVLLPRNAAYDYPVRPWTQIRIIDQGITFFPIWNTGQAGVQVTAKFGWAAVPDLVKQACILAGDPVVQVAGRAVWCGADGPRRLAMRIKQGLHPVAAALLTDLVKYEDANG